ncbi:hypothetical protein SLS54_005827 [Diplodia seriata]
MSRGGCSVDEDEDDEEVEVKLGLNAKATRPGSPGRTLGIETQLSFREAYLFDYFISFICPNCSLSPTHNPYLRYITPMALSYAPLQHVILSVAANQLRLLNDNRYEREAWLYKACAMRGLRASMDAGHVGWPFVATVLMLCFYDISDGCDESWITHLKGGLGVLQHVQGAASRHTEGAALTRFFMMYFMAHQIMSATARETSPTMPGHEWLGDDCMDEIDTMMGCSRGLLSLIDQTSTEASYYSTISRSRAFSNEELDEIRLIWEHLSSAIRAAPQVASPTSIASEKADHLVRVANCKRTAALIYLHERFASFLSELNASEAKKSSIAQLVSQLAVLPATPTLLWPLFILGRASPESEDHRRFVLDRLTEMQRLRNLGSVRLARRLVEGEYRRYDLNLDGSGPRNEVGVRGKWISLA